MCLLLLEADFLLKFFPGLVNLLMIYLPAFPALRLITSLSNRIPLPL